MYDLHVHNLSIKDEFLFRYDCINGIIKNTFGSRFTS